MRFFQFTHKTVNIILFCLIAVAIIGSVSLLPNLIDNVPNTFFKNLDFIIVIIIITLLVRRKKNQFHVGSFVTKLPIFLNKKFLLVMLAIFVLAWQFSCVFYLNGHNAWDPQILVDDILNEHTYPVGKTLEYLSIYPNNIMLFNIEKIIFNVFGQPDQQHFFIQLDVVNVVIVDLAFIMLVLSMRKLFSKKVVVLTGLFALVLYVLVPFFVIPYTDTMGFLLSTLAIFIFTVLMTSTLQKKRLLFLGFLNGCTFAFAYQMKPSLILIFISELAYITLLFIKKSNLSKSTLPFLLTSFIALLFVSFGLNTINSYVYNGNNSVKIDKSMAMPMAHFASIGLSDSGGFQREEVYEMNAIKNPKERNQTAVQNYKKRLKQRGIFGYQRFLFHKQLLNTSDGTFQWAPNGYYLIAFDPDDKEKNNSIIRQIYMGNHGNAVDASYSFKSIQQIFWVLMLVIILVSIFETSEFTAFFKISAIAFFVFLLIFEGGHTRYLIQFLPILFVLMATGLEVVFKSYNKFSARL